MSTTFPTPPGRLGVAAQPQEMLAYLGGLEAWLGQRRQELDSLDSQILSTGRRDELTGDMTLSLSLWQSIRNRQQQLLTTWDSGRVGRVELERLSGLIWGRLDTAAGEGQAASMAVSLPEAGRLSDALVDQLRTRLNTDPHAEQQQMRLRNLQAQLERLRDQAALEPAGRMAMVSGQVEGLATRWSDIEAKRGRGGDVGGLLGPLEIEAARLERDLIVGSAQRRQARDLVLRARQHRSSLAAREQAVAALAAQVRLDVWPAPTESVPTLAVLGPMPNTQAALSDHLARLEDHADHLARLEAGLRASLAEVEQAAGLAEALAAKARVTGGADPVLEATFGALDVALAHRPVALPVLRHLLQSATARLDQITGGRQ